MAVGGMREWNGVGEGDSYENGKSQLTKIRGVCESLEDDDVSYPGAAYHV